MAVAFALFLTACSTSIAPIAETSEPNSTVSIVTTSTSTVPTHTPYWLTIKYRSDSVDVAEPRFVYLDGGSSSLVDAAFYDAENKYMIVSLKRGAYHYCGVLSSVWSAFTAAPSLGSFYNTQIKGRFDCRTGIVPEY